MNTDKEVGKNEHHISTGRILPRKNTEGIEKFPSPHEEYIRAAQKIIQTKTSGIKCFVYVDYSHDTNSFKVDRLKSINITRDLAGEIEGEIISAVHLLQQNRQ